MEIRCGDGQIEKDTIVVSSGDVAEPVAVRYAWGGDSRREFV